MVEGFGSAVLPQPYQQEATPTPRPACPLASAKARVQCGSKRCQAVVDARRAQGLAGGRGIAVTQRVQQAELQPVDPGLVGQPVVERFLPERALRHAEAPEGTGNRTVGVDRAGLRA